MSTKKPRGRFHLRVNTDTGYKRWQVVHTLSDHGLMFAASKKLALAAITELDATTDLDWERPFDALNADQSLIDAVRPIAEKASRGPEILAYEAEGRRLVIPPEPPGLSPYRRYERYPVPRTQGKEDGR